MATSKKLMGTTAVGGFTAVEDVFQSYLYAGNSSTQTITNGIDLAGEGGMVWVKNRTTATQHILQDTERGITHPVYSDLTNGQGSQGYLDAVYNDGFRVALNSVTVNVLNEKYTSWTFRKAPRFFDVVTYTGTGSGGFEVAHNLGQDVGFIAIKRTDSTSDWTCWHVGRPNSYLVLNSTAAEVTTASSVASRFGDNTSIIQPTSTNFTLGGTWGVNQSGGTYVAYLYAHDPLGPSGDGSDGLIACGSYTGTGSTRNDIDLGFEPQWLLIKKASSTGNWWLFDNMRGLPTFRVNSPPLHANSSNDETTIGITDWVSSYANGFSTEQPSFINNSGETFVYIAIRRGPMRQPESGSEVFAMDTLGGTLPNPPAFDSGHVVDMALSKSTAGGSSVFTARMTGDKFLLGESTAAESSSASYTFDYMEGWRNSTAVNSAFYSWMFRRAPGFFDVTTWAVDGTGDQTINHNLGVVPEMIISKNRDDGSAGSGSWWIGHKDLTGWDSANQNDRHALQFTTAASAQQGYHRDFTDSSIRLLSNVAGGYVTGHDCVAYLFASLPGISKVGSYTGNGSSQTINCGFTSGARFVLIKRTDSTGDWYVWDTARGIVAANDPHLSLNTTAAEVTTDDSVDPDSSGFIVNQNTATNINVSSASYSYLAIA